MSLLQFDLRDENSFMQTLIAKQVLRRSNVFSCGHDMVLFKTRPGRNVPKVWRCHRCKREVSVLTGSFFANYSIRLSLICFSLTFLLEGIPMCSIHRLLNVSLRFLTNFSNHVHDMVFLRGYKFHSEIQIGGSNKIVEIDETFYGNNFIIFGGICHHDHECFMEMVPNIQIETIDPIIRKYVKPGTRVVSDGAGLYTNLKNRMPVIVSEHHVVVHSRFQWVNDAGFTTNHIENLWGQLKKECPTPLNEQNLMKKIKIFVYFYNTSNSRALRLDHFLDMIKIADN